ncbi:MAG: hypothetical protein B7X12_03345 [Halothiobacillus sp. 20-53-49]|nr:MAG: hypothetical protein B7X12_03345 [Halothiobacillus sp. 20-53-49]
MKKIPIYLFFGFLPLVLITTGCSTPRATFTQDSFSNNSPYQQHVAVPASRACAAAERTLLGDGYSLDNTAKTGSVKGRKAYLTGSGRSSFLEMSVVCLPDATGSTIYANGLISQYDLKKSANAASVGVSVLGSISMPIGQSVDSMVKVSDETIRDRVFYKNFFSAIETVLQDPLLEAASAPAPIKLAPVQAPPPNAQTVGQGASPALPAHAIATSPPVIVPTPEPTPVPVPVPVPEPSTTPIEPAVAQPPSLEKQFQGDNKAQSTPPVAPDLASPAPSLPPVPSAPVAHTPEPVEPAPIEPAPIEPESVAPEPIEPSAAPLAQSPEPTHDANSPQATPAP